MIQPTSRHLVLKTAKRVFTGILYMPMEKAYYGFKRRNTFHKHICHLHVYANSYIAIFPPISLEVIPLFALGSSSNYDQPICPTDFLKRRDLALKVLYYVQTFFLTVMTKDFHPTISSMILVTMLCQKTVILEPIVMIYSE